MERCLCATSKNDLRFRGKISQTRAAVGCWREEIVWRGPCFRWCRGRGRCRHSVPIVSRWRLTDITWIYGSNRNQLHAYSNQKIERTSHHRTCTCTSSSPLRSSRLGLRLWEVGIGDDEVLVGIMRMGGRVSGKGRVRRRRIEGACRRSSMMSERIRLGLKF